MTTTGLSRPQTTTTNTQGASHAEEVVVIVGITCRLAKGMTFDPVHFLERVRVDQPRSEAAHAW